MSAMYSTLTKSSVSDILLIVCLPAQLHHVDGLTNLEVRHVASESNLQAGDAVPLIGSTGQIWGAVRPTLSALPSVGLCLHDLE